MQAHYRSSPLIGALLTVALFAAPAAAGTITIGSFSTPGASTGTAGPVSTLSVNNDNVAAASSNVVPFSVFFNTLGVLETEFNVTNSAGVTEYRFVQTFVNNTGTTWRRFLFEIGFGLGANFVAAGPVVLVDFDTPDRDPAITSAAFPTVVHSSNMLDWRGGSLAPVGTAGFAFAIDVPDNLQDVHPGGVNRFTLRQTPLEQDVPEPAALTLLSAGLAAIGIASRRLR